MKSSIKMFEMLTRKRKERKGIDWYEDKEYAEKGKKFRIRVTGDYQKFQFEPDYLPDEYFDTYEEAKKRVDELFENNPHISSGEVDALVTVPAPKYKQDKGIETEDRWFGVYGRTMGSFGCCP